jgi:hypothetical protein
MCTGQAAHPFSGAPGRIKAAWWYADPRWLAEHTVVAPEGADVAAGAR